MKYLASLGALASVSFVPVLLLGCGGGDQPTPAPAPAAITYDKVYPWVDNCTDGKWDGGKWVRGASIFGKWDRGACMSGVKRGLWTILPNGTNTHLWEPSICDSARGQEIPWSLSCEARQVAWKAKTKVLNPVIVDVGNVINLVVFLPGTGGTPRGYSSLLQAAANAGNYVIGLSHYSQPVAVAQFNAWCTASASPDNRKAMAKWPGMCNRELHELMLFGVAPTDLQGAGQGLWNVDTSHSVASLLLHTLKLYPWGVKYLTSDGEGVNWKQNVIISGHSQGAGHAAYLSYKLQVPAVLFSGPQDSAGASSWVAEMGLQSGVLRRALFHVNEECGPKPIAPKSYCEPDLMTEQLTQMGLEKPYQTWSGKSNGTILLTSQVVMSTAAPTCPDGRLYHESVADERCMSADIMPLWQALFTFENTPRAGVII